MSDTKEFRNSRYRRYIEILVFMYCIVCVYACNSVDGQRVSPSTSKAEVIPDMKNKSLEPQQYLDFVQENQEALSVQQEMGSYTFTATYLPLSYQALLSTRRSHHADSAVKAFLKDNQQSVFFLFKIRNNKSSGTDLLRSISASGNDYYKNLDYFSFRIQNDFFLINGKDTVPCTLHHYERGYDAKPDAVFMLNFDVGKIDQEQDLTLSYTDQLFGLGRLNFRISKENIHHLPSLSLN